MPGDMLIAEGLGTTTQCCASAVRAFPRSLPRLREKPKRSYGNLPVRKGAKRSAPPLKPHSHSTLSRIKQL
jgi:hypothetical protein